MYPVVRVLLQQISQDFVRGQLTTYNGEPSIETSFPLPYDEATIHQRLVNISDAIGREIPFVEDIGKALYQAIFSNEQLYDRLKSAMNLAETANTELHLQLVFRCKREDAILHSYPWELMHDRVNYLQAGRRVVISRYLDLDSPIQALSVDGPVRVLIVSPSSPDSKETQTIERTLREANNPDRINVESLKSSSFQDFVEFLTASQQQFPHVIHFDGHAHYGWLCRNFNCQEFTSWPAETCRGCHTALTGDPTGYLEFYEENGDKTFINAETFASQVIHSGVQLIVLSACNTAHIAGRTELSSLAESLVVAGVPAVLGMQFPIPFDTAETFMRVFYLSITEFDPIGEATARARAAVFNDVWFPPVLYLREKDDTGQLFAGRILTEKIPRAKALYGRETHLKEIAYQILHPASRGVLVWGMAGSGKSAFAAECAVRLAWRFKNGVIWVEAEKQSVESLVSTIAEQIVGLDLSQLSSTTARVSKLVEALKKGTYLLVIDGLEVMVQDNQKEEVCDFLLQVAATTKLIITSREVLALDHIQTYELPDLETQAALSFFMGNIESKRRSEANVDQIAKRIVDDLLGRHPLAIEIAAGLTRRSDMTIAALEKALERRQLSLLDDSSWANRPPQLKNVRVSFDSSFQALTDRERLVFTQLAVLQNPWDEATGRAVTGLDQNDWFRIHNELQDMSLLRAQTGKYVFHPLIKEFGYEHLANKIVTHQRAADHLSKSRDPIYRAEAFYHAMQAQDFQSAAEILLSVYEELRSKGRYVHLLGMLSEVINKQLVPDYRFYLRQAEVLRILGSVDKALKRLQWMLQRLPLQPEERVLVLNERARILKELDRPGDVDQAILDHAESLKICDVLTGKAGKNELWLREKRASVLHDLGMLFHYYKKTHAALIFAKELYTISLISWRKIAQVNVSRRVNEALTLKQLAELTAWPGNPERNTERASMLFEEAITIFKTAAEEYYMGETLFQVAKLKQDVGQFDIALSKFEECEELYKHIGLKPEAAIMVKQQGEIFQDRNDEKRNIRRAIDLYSQALQELPNYTDKWSRRCTVRAFYRRGEAYLETQRTNEAKDDFLKSTSLAVDMAKGSSSDQKQIVRSFCALAGICKLSDRSEIPLTLVDSAKLVFRNYGFDLNNSTWQSVDCRKILDELNRKWFHHDIV